MNEKPDCLLSCSSPTNYVSSSDDMPTTNVLTGCNICVDVWAFNGTDNRSNVFENILIRMGANIVKNWTKNENVTQLVFKSGHKSFLQKAKKFNVPVVSCDWVTQCREKQQRVEENEFIVDIESYKPPRRFKEMQPVDSLTRLQRSNERIKRIKNKETKKKTNVFFRSPLATSPLTYSPNTSPLGFSPNLNDQSTVLAPNTPFPTQQCPTTPRYFSPLIIPESPCDESTNDTNNSENIFTQNIIEAGRIVAPNTPFLTQKMHQTPKYFSPIMVPESPCETLKSKLMRINNAKLTPPNLQNKVFAIPMDVDLTPGVVACSTRSSLESNHTMSPPLRLYLSEHSSDASSIADIEIEESSIPPVIDYEDLEEVRHHAVKEKFDKENIECNSILKGVAEVINCNKTTLVEQSMEMDDELNSKQSNIQIELTNGNNPNNIGQNQCDKPKSKVFKGTRKVFRNLLNATEDAGPLSFLGSPGLNSTQDNSMVNPLINHKVLVTGSLMGKDFKKLKISSSEKVTSQKSTQKNKRKRSALKNVTDEYQNNKTEASKLTQKLINEFACNRRSSTDFQPTKELVRFNSKRREKINIVLTNFHRTERAQLLKVIEKYKTFKVRSSVTKDTTHVVCGANRRTLSVVYALAYGTWLVSDKWVMESIKNNNIIKEDKFELKEGFPSACINRISKQTERKWKNNVFIDLGEVCFVSESTTPPQKNLSELLQLCGAKVTKSCLRATLCVGECNKDFWHNSQVPRVNEKWVLDCIEQNKLLDITSYKV